jgi:hypothetical protein
MEGIHGIKPVIKRVVWPAPGKIQIDLEDGRSLISPLKLYPGIKKLSTKNRKTLMIVDDQILLFREGTDEVYHLQDFLGKEIDYRYKG